MKIHQYTNQNFVHLEEFAQTVFRRHINLFQDVLASLHSPNNKGIYAIENEKGPVVVATTHQSVWHPYCIYVRIAYRLCDVPSDALQKMVKHLKRQYELSLFVLIDDRFEGIEEVLQSSGLRCIRKTEIIEIKPREAKVLMNKNVTAISDILHDSNLMMSLIELCKTTYTKTHLANPVGHFPLISWEDIVMEELSTKYSYVVIKNQQVIAFSLMYEGEGATWELGWVGVDEYSSMTLVDRLITKQLYDASRNGIVSIEKEVDSTCPYSLHIANSIAHDVSKTFFAYKS